MKKLLWVSALFISLCVAAYADVVEGRIASLQEDGTIVVAFGATDEIQARDVFAVLQKGAVIGECLVMSVGKSQVKMLAKGGFKGTARVGDIVRFERHADMPIDGTEGWKKWECPDGKFSVILPHGPSEAPKKEHHDTASGPIDYVFYVIVDGSDSMVYTIETNDYDLKRLGPDEHYLDDATQLDHMVKSLADSKGWRVQWNRPFTMLGYSGREVEAFVKSSSIKDEVMIRSKLLFVDSRLYVLSAVSTRSPGISSRSWKFLNSLQLKAGPKR